MATSKFLPGRCCCTPQTCLDCVALMPSTLTLTDPFGSVTLTRAGSSWTGCTSATLDAWTNCNYAYEPTEAPAAVPISYDLHCTSASPWDHRLALTIAWPRVTVRTFVGGIGGSWVYTVYDPAISWCYQCPPGVWHTYSPACPGPFGGGACPSPVDGANTYIFGNLSGAYTDAIADCSGPISLTVSSSAGIYGAGGPFTITITE